MSNRLYRITATALMAAISVAPMSGQGIAQAAPSAVVMDAKSDANQLRTDAISLRSQVSTLLQSYMDTYSDRFTAQELKQLTALKSNADRQMAAVVLSVNRLRTAVIQGKSASAITAAKANATRAWSRAKSTAETSWEQARVIVEPKLSLFERLGALGDYNDTMARFDDLGADIADLPTR